MTGRGRAGRLRRGRPGLAAPVVLETFSFAGCRAALWAVFTFSFVGGGISALGAIFVLQIYDRVLPSHSLATLGALAAIFAAAYVVHGGLEAASGRVSERLGLRLLDRYEPIFLRLASRERSGKRTRAEAEGPLNDFLDVVAAIRGRALQSVFDLAWAVILVLLLALVSPYLSALAAALVLMQVLAVVVLSAEEDGPARDAHWELWRASRARDQRMAAPLRRVADQVARARVAERHALLGGRERERDLRAVALALREIAHSGVLALGAWLVLTDAMSLGAMMASGLLMMRIYGPVQAALREQVALRRAAGSLARLRTHDLSEAGRDGTAVLTEVSGRIGRLTVSRLALVPPREGAGSKGVTFTLEAGRCLALVGRSGSGKSLLLKRLGGFIGARPAAVRLDEWCLSALSDEQLARTVGYLPQEPTFLPGTIAQAVSGFDPNCPPERIHAACRRVGVHEAIAALPDGYDTQIASDRVPLPSTMLRLVAFARALVWDPPLLLLDDPFQGHGAETRAWLAGTVRQAKEDGVIVLVSAPDIAAVGGLADFVMTLEAMQLVRLLPVRAAVHAAPEGTADPMARRPAAAAS